MNLYKYAPAILLVMLFFNAQAQMPDTLMNRYATTEDADF